MIKTVTNGELIFKPETATDFAELIQDLSTDWGMPIPEDQLALLVDAAVANGHVTENRPHKRN
jgi:hypothetical protein